MHTSTMFQGCNSLRCGGRLLPFLHSFNRIISLHTILTPLLSFFQACWQEAAINQPPLPRPQQTTGPWSWSELKLMDPGSYITYMLQPSLGSGYLGITIVQNWLDILYMLHVSLMTFWHMTASFLMVKTFLVEIDTISENQHGRWILCYVKHAHAFETNCIKTLGAILHGGWKVWYAVLYSLYNIQCKCHTVHMEDQKCKDSVETIVCSLHFQNKHLVCRFQSRLGKVWAAAVAWLLSDEILDLRWDLGSQMRSWISCVLLSAL